MPYFIEDSWDDKERFWFEELAQQSRFVVAARKQPFGDAVEIYYRLPKELQGASGAVHQAMLVRVLPDGSYPPVAEVASVLARSWTSQPRSAPHCMPQNPLDYDAIHSADLAVE